MENPVNLNGLNVVVSKFTKSEKYCQIRFPCRMSNRRITKKWRKRKWNWGMKLVDSVIKMGNTVFVSPEVHAKLNPPVSETDNE